MRRVGIWFGGLRAACWAASALVCVAALPARTVELTSELDRYIQAEMELNRLPGVSAALVDAERVIYLRSHGVRDVENGDAMTTETLVDLASVSKSMTALAVIQLEEHGLVELDAPVLMHPGDDVGCG